VLEEELLEGVTGALTAGAWRWHHVRRSDLALQQGQSGFPDIFALHPERRLVFVAELKGDGGRMGSLQVDWLAAFEACGIEAGIVTPSTYDATVEHLVGDRLVKPRRRWRDHPENDD
jgi:hypothetical protein